MVEWRWPNFSKDELKCKCCGAHVIVEEFLDRLQKLRLDFGKPIKISSGYRCSKHNNEVSDTGLTGVHTTGRAVDIMIDRKNAYDLLHLALLYGFTGVGIKQHGPTETRFLHLDDCPDRMIRPTIWSYT